MRQIDLKAMPYLSVLLASLALLSTLTSAQADCLRDRTGQVICDRGQCARSSHGAVRCSRFEDGAALRDRYGDVVCGKGSCVKTRTGVILCAKRPGGAAAADRYGDVTCEGGCEDASARFCGPNDADR